MIRSSATPSDQFLRVLVTGAATGLGRDIALALLQAGHRVAGADIDREGLEDLKTQGIAPIALDLRSEDSIEAAYGAACEAVGTIDILVNNAGLTIHKPAFDLSWDEWDSVHAVNLKGAFFMARTVARRLADEGLQGGIISLASAHGLVGFPNRAAYGISKAAIIHMTRTLAVEWAPYGIRVNAVAPGTVMTPSRQKLLADPGALETMRSRIPLGRFPTAAEVSGAVLYLVSPHAASVTGHTLVLDGGTSVA